MQQQLLQLDLSEALRSLLDSGLVLCQYNRPVSKKLEWPPTLKALVSENLEIDTTIRQCLPGPETVAGFKPKLYCGYGYVSLE